jgi:peptidoglycan-associated lipoprotein
VSLPGHRIYNESIISLSKVGKLPMIDPSILKSTASLLLAVALLAGCSSNPSSDDVAATADVYGAEDAVKVDAADGRAAIDGQGGYDEAIALSLDNVFYFDFDQSQLRLDVRAALDEHAAYLRNKTGIVRLEGHADERGTREYNLALAERRARAIANYLSIQGVSNSQIETISYGEEKPATLGHSEAAWSKNRRVELIYLD